MRTLRRLVEFIAVAMVGVVMASVLVATTPAGAAPTSPGAPDGPYDENLALQHDQLVAIEQFRKIADSDPERFAGVSTKGSGRVTINLVDRPGQPGPNLAEIKREAAAVGIALSVRYRKHSFADLARVRDELIRRGVSTSRINPDSNSVEVRSVDGQVALQAQVGDAVTITNDAAPATRLLGRFNDTSPFYGGIRIGNPIGACTYGFGLTNLYGTRYAITAGHCWALGSRVSAMRQYGGTNNVGSGYDDFGSVAFRTFSQNSLDNELIGGRDYAGRMWVGGSLADDNTVSVPVHDARASCVGCSVYFNGSFTGKSLAVITSYDGCGDYFGDGIVSCGLWQVRSANGQRVCQGGDSGGPVFGYDGRGGITAVGIITGGSGDGKTCWFTDVPQILSYWQSTITTG